MYCILSNLVLDHDPQCRVKIDVAAKGNTDSFCDLPHVHPSLATMSRQFRAVVEGLCRHHVTCV